MTTDARVPDGRDPDVTRLLRAAYEPPADPAYWEGLERRILARVTAAGAAPAAEWWEAFAGWTRAGLIAASLAAAVTTAAMFQTRAAAVRVAYEAVVESPPLISGAQTMRTVGVSERDPTLRYTAPY
jgi:hypothetical protein